MNKYKADVIAVGFIVFVVAVFFLPLFWPESRLMVTPDFGRSDAWHFSMPTRYFYWQKLHTGQMPLWSAHMGSGFPILGEGQTGIFFLPNLLIYSLSSFPLAYNVSLIFTLLTIGVGFYVWLRLLGINYLVSFFGSVSVVFSGMIIPQMPHITLLQGISLLPWVMISTKKLKESKSILWVCVYAIILSQQVLTGFPQAVFITLLLSGVYFWWFKKSVFKYLKQYLYFGFAIIIGIGLSQVQLLPSIEFYHQTTISQGLALAETTKFSFPYTHLITLFDPFFFGNPKLGTYPPFTQFDGSIFWENSAFIGWLFLLGGFGLIWGWKSVRSQYKRLLIFLAVVTVASFLLMLGKYSPFYFMYLFWPFHHFRVPARFIWTFLFGIISLCAIGWQVGLNKLKFRDFSKLISLIIILHVVLILNTWKNYHYVDSAEKWLSKTAFDQYLDSHNRVITLFSEQRHNDYFIHQGWVNPLPYLTLRNNLAPNSNLFWNIDNHEVYAGRFLRRQEYMSKLFSSQVEATNLTPKGHKLLDLFAIDTVIAAESLDDPKLNQVDVLNQNDITLTIYRNQDAVSRVYVVSDIKTAETLTEATKLLESDDFVIGKSALLEQSVSLDTVAATASAKIVRETDTEVVIYAKAVGGAGVLVLADTYYPGWEANIDGEQAQIMPANIRQRAVVVPEGDHIVTFRYRPRSFLIGAAISGASWIIVLVLLSFMFINKRFSILP